MTGRYMTDAEIAAEQATLGRYRITPPVVDETAEPVTTDDVTPLDLLHSDAYTSKLTRDGRLDTCKGCDRLFAPTRTCRECGCFMALKTWLSDARCPLGKW